MSLINQMLKDLDERNAPEIHNGLQHEIRRLSDVAGQKRRRFMLAFALLAAATGGALGYAYVSGVPISIPGLFALPAASSSAGAGAGDAQKTPAIPLPASSDPVAASFLTSLGAAIIPPDASGGQQLQAVNEKLLLLATELASTVQKPEAGVPGPAVEERAVVPPSASLPRRKPDIADLPKEKPRDAPPPKDISAAAAPAGRSSAATPRPGSAGAAVVEKSAPVGRLRERAEADYRSAMTRMAAGQPQQALDQLLDVLRYDGSHVQSRQLAVRLLVEQGRPDEAMAILAEGLAGQPGQIQWAMLLARLQVDRGDLEAAARTLHGSSSFAAASGDYHGFAGFVAHRLGRQQESADHYRTAIGIAPGEGRWWFGLGLALEAGKHANEAREAFRRARASGTLNPDLNLIVDQKLR